MQAQIEFEFVGQCHGYNIPKATREQIIKYLEKNRPMIYADRNDRLSLEQVAKILDNPDGICEVENSIWENCMDYSWELEMGVVHELQERFEELAAMEDTAVREEFLDYLSCDIDYKGIIRNTPDVVLRITLHSNYEGVNWAERGDGDFKASEYMGQIKKLLRGKYDEKSFQQELDNIMSSCNQFVFLIKVPVENIIEIAEKNWDKITIPKNAWAGFYDKWNGSGSVLEVKLLKDITLKRQWGKTEYDSVSVYIDEVEKYSVDEVYGLCGYPEGPIKAK
jgi:hypothetical protein